MEAAELRETLIEALRSIYTLEAFAALSDLLQGEMLVLQYLAGTQSAAVYPSTLSKKLHLSPSRITAALSSLRRKGLVETEASLSDRRRIQVEITPAGQAHIGGKFHLLESYFDRLIAGLGEGDSRSLIALIGRCVAVMDAPEKGK
ncbi:MAG: MarR family winged helix-turn-helix transcriptional regulator [Ruthenibacterium sp.]